MSLEKKTFIGLSFSEMRLPERHQNALAGTDTPHSFSSLARSVLAHVFWFYSARIRVELSNIPNLQDLLLLSVVAANRISDSMNVY